MNNHNCKSKNTTHPSHLSGCSLPLVTEREQRGRLYSLTRYICKPLFSRAREDSPSPNATPPYSGPKPRELPTARQTPGPPEEFFQPYTAVRFWVAAPKETDKRHDKCQSPIGLTGKCDIDLRPNNKPGYARRKLYCKSAHS